MQYINWCDSFPLWEGSKGTHFVAIEGNYYKVRKVQEHQEIKCKVYTI
jgi:hypothetical protein